MSLQIEMPVQLAAVPPASAAGQTTARLQKIGGRNFAFGLRWFPESSPGAAWRDARARAKQFDAPIICVHRSSPPLFGLGWLEDRKLLPRGLNALLHRWYPAAATLADAIEDDWIGAWEIAPRCWWIASAAHGRVALDRLITESDETSAYQALRKQLDAAGDALKFTAIVPPHWSLDPSVPRAHHGLAEILISRPRTRIRQRDISRRPIFVAAGLLLLLIAAARWGYPALKAGLAPLPAPIRQAAPAPAPPPPEPQPPPRLVARPSSYFSACFSALDPMVTNRAGAWRLLRAECGTDAAASYSAVDRFVFRETLRAAADAAGATLDVRDDGRSATLRRALPSIAMFSIPPISATVEERSNRLTDAAMRVGMSVTIRREGAKTLFALNSPVPPRAWSDRLDAIGGLEITSISMDLTYGSDEVPAASWRIEGIVHAGS